MDQPRANSLMLLNDFAMKYCGKCMSSASQSNERYVRCPETTQVNVLGPTGFSCKYEDVINTKLDHLNFEDRSGTWISHRISCVQRVPQLSLRSGMYIGSTI